MHRRKSGPGLLPRTRRCRSKHRVRRRRTGREDFIVCGHSACRAATAPAEEQDLSATPVIACGLRHADAATAHAVVDRALTLHGWMFDIATGAIETIDGVAAAT
ncbi:hypothetical protein [Streptomyces yanii]|uniref:Carbonic anhydrase n=1 Tax=Streptomyces yanii TaxID=78510 RepID=A0ABV5RF69_9ACTN